MPSSLELRLQKQIDELQRLSLAGDARADAGDIANFPGVTAPYEPPSSADLVLPTETCPVSECVERIIELLTARKVIA